MTLGEARTLKLGDWLRRTNPRSADRFGRPVCDWQQVVRIAPAAGGTMVYLRWVEAMWDDDTDSALLLAELDADEWALRTRVSGPYADE